MIPLQEKLIIRVGVLRPSNRREERALLTDQLIVCISSADWDPIWTRKQQVMSRLDRFNPILYVEPPASLLSPFKDPACWRKWWRWREGHTVFRG
ncbi:MAG TPA: hypothetical protein DCE07_00385 [Peptococcaceae bacterium]|nr:hypothetical protein [Peptococcaceae bacterium]